MASPSAPTINHNAHAFAARLVAAAATFTGAVGGIVLVGWLLDNRLLKGGVLGSTVMNFNAAVCFVLAGLSLLTLAGGTSTRWRWLGGACALLVALTGLVTFAEHVFDWSVGINRLFIQPPTGASPLHYRMAPFTAFCFLLTGAALLLRHAWRALKVAQALVFLLLLVAWLALVSYAYGVTYGTVHLPAMALFSALTFNALGVGLLCVQPAEGIVALLAGDRLGSRLARQLLPAALVFPVILGWLRTLGERAGLYDSPFGAALLITSSIVILVAVIWRAASGLNRSDAMRRHAEEELRRSHTELEARVQERTAELERQSVQLRAQAQLLDTVEQAVIATDPSGRITYWNRFAEKLYGWPAAEAVGRNIVEVTPADESKTQSTEIMTRLAAGESWSGEFQVRHRDGTSFPVQITDTPIFDAAGRLVGVVGVSADITERRRAEGERNELLRRAQAARAQAEEASRLKDEFLATVSHELRTPMTAILGWARLLQTTDLDDEIAARALDTIERNARAQAQLIEDLLDVSRVIAGKLRLDVRHVELAPIVAAAVEAARPAADAKGVHLRSFADERAPAVLGDADRLQQVVWNLLSNAIKFTPRGGEVWVGLARRAGHAEISVRDTGQGIAPDFLPHVFDRFRQADGTPTRAHGGLGLGLAIVRHLVELHGGTVAATSAGEGQGATFTVQLPATELRIDDYGLRNEEAASGQSEIRNSQPAMLQGLHVLVVDDEADARELITLALAQGGAHVAAVASAAEALAAFAAQRPDLLVSDIGMPGTDGYALIREVRAQEAARGLAHLPAVALTAYARPDDRAQALRAGYDAHVAKPVEPAELVVQLARLAKLGMRDEG